MSDGKFLILQSVNIIDSTKCDPSYSESMFKTKTNFPTSVRLQPDAYIMFLDNSLMQQGIFNGTHIGGFDSTASPPSEPQVKTLKMEPFSEGLFIILFYNLPTFQYSPIKRMYTCKFKGGQGYEQLGNFFDNKNWELRYGSMRFEFNIDVRDFVE
ncbi:2299_t:CDS:2, partial [Funneliformis geosporum]